MRKTLLTAFVLTLAGCAAEDEYESETYGPINKTVDYISHLEGMRKLEKTLDGGEIDESYVYIDSTGYIQVFDYQGDEAGSGLNCYTYATNPEQTNSMIHGRQITYEIRGDAPPEYEGIEDFWKNDTNDTRMFIVIPESISPNNIEFNSHYGSGQFFDFKFGSIYWSSRLGITLENGYNFSFKATDENFFEVNTDVLLSDIESAMCSE